MTRSLAFVNGNVVDDAVLNDIIRSIVFFGDTATIRCASELRSSENSDPGQISRKIEELVEAGFVRFWAHEYEVKDSGRFRLSKLFPDRKAEIVVAPERLATPLGELDEILDANREQAYSSNLQLRQGLGEVVRMRGELTNLVIASELESDGIVGSHSSRKVVERGLRGEGSKSFRDSVVTEVLGSLQIESLTMLSMDQIQQARSFGSEFRKRLDEAILSAANNSHTDVSVEAVAKEMVAAYKEALSDYPVDHSGKALREDVVWDVAGAIVPPTVLLKYGVKAFKWYRGAKQARPFLMLSSVQRIAMQKAELPRSR